LGSTNSYLALLVQLARRAAALLEFPAAAAGAGIIAAEDGGQQDIGFSGGYGLQAL